MSGAPRLYLAPEKFDGDRVTLDGEALRHLRTVLRLRPGDVVVITEGLGGEYEVRLEPGGARDAWTGRVLSRARPGRESPLRLVLAQALAKGDRFAHVLEKAVELGVSEIRPIITARTVPAAARDAGGRRERWARIVESALAQSGRTRLPRLHPAGEWAACAAATDDIELRILLWEREARGLGEVLRGVAAPASVMAAVGPEGGWAEEEVAVARRHGFVTASLGPRRLRTDTAGPAVLAVLQHLHGDLR